MKNSLVNILHFHNLNQALINSLLSDEFINGAYNLIKNEPEDDEFMAFNFISGAV